MDKKLQIIPLGGLGEFGMNSHGHPLRRRHHRRRRRHDVPRRRAAGRRHRHARFHVSGAERRARPRPDSHARPRGSHRRRSRSCWRSSTIPVYGTAFTLALVERRLEEHEMLDEAKLNIGQAGRESGAGAVLDRVHPRHALHRAAASRWRSPRRWASSSTPAISRWIPRPPTTSCSICTRWPSTASAACCC